MAPDLERCIRNASPIILTATTHDLVADMSPNHYKASPNNAQNTLNVKVKDILEKNLDYGGT
jgi:hypothetical protein